jgi:hypothetical protein
MSRQVWEVAETKISAGVSRVTLPDELNKIVQYYKRSDDESSSGWWSRWSVELVERGVADSIKEGSKSILLAQLTALSADSEHSALS